MTLTYDVEYLKAISFDSFFYFCVCFKQMSWIVIVVRDGCSFRGIDDDHQCIHFLFIRWQDFFAIWFTG